MMRIFIIIFAIFILSTYAHATPEYSQRTGQGCMICHIKPEGGVLSERGLEFAASGYKWPPEGGYRVLGPLRKSVRLILGLIHIVAGFLWFGGEDLTEALSKAPHGEEKLSTLKQVGRFDASLKPPLRSEQKAFYFIAYMNLGLVFLVLIVISLWRWGL